MAVTLVTGNAAGTASGNKPLGPQADPAAISADGRYVVFQSQAADLVAGSDDANNAGDIFLYDRQTNATQLISKSRFGPRTGNGASASAVISADGNYIAFVSLATDLNGDTDADYDAFLYDVAAQTLRAVSGTLPNAVLPKLSFSDDGRFLAFATNDGVYRYDRLTDTNAAISVRGDGQLTVAGASADPMISADGRFVLFKSFAADLHPGDVSNDLDLFLRDTQAGVTYLCSPGAAGNLASTFAGLNASMSGDGNIVVFDNALAGGDLVPGSVYVLIFSTAEIRKIDTPGSNSTISRNGRTVIFDGAAGGVFFYDTVADTTFRIGTSNTARGARSVSDDGRFIPFTATDPLDIDTNNAGDVYVFDVTNNQYRLLSVNASLLGTGNSESHSPVIAGSGTAVIFQSAASDLVSGFFDGNAGGIFAPDVFAAQTLDGLSVGDPGGPPPPPPPPPSSPPPPPPPPPIDPPPEVAPDLTISVASAFSSAVAGQRKTAKLRIGNDGNQKVKRTVEVAVFLSNDSAVSSIDRQVVFSRKKIQLSPGKSKSYDFKFTVPADLAGGFFLIAQVDGADAVLERDESNNTTFTFPVLLAAPTVDLTGTFRSTPSTLSRNSSKNAQIRVASDGNTKLDERVVLQVFASLDGVLDSGDIFLGQKTQTLSINPGKSKTVKIKVKAPQDLPPAEYFLIAVIDTTNTVIEGSESNNNVTSGSTSRLS